MSEKQSDEITNSDAQWESFSSLEAEREILIPDSDDELGFDNDSHASITQRMRESPKLTDAQTFDKRLFPKQKTEWLELLQVSRIFPDNFNDLFIILVKDLMSEDKNITLGEAIAQVHTALSIALDGEGRIDELQLAGSAAPKEDYKGGGI
jgi:hypothetical protein